MKIYNNISEFERVNGAVVTIGTFDGVHQGHRKIISNIVDLAKATGGESIILTFFPHPRMILHPEDQSLKLITTMEEKAQLLEQLGVDHLIITPFSRDFSNQTPEYYIEQVLFKQIGTGKIVIGYDHRFGKDRSGSLDDLQRLAPGYGYDVIEIPEQDINEVAVSSTRIRAALLGSDISSANECLGYPFFMTGKVIRGDQIGRTMGYPTANIQPSESYKLIPGDGIFAVFVEIEGQQFKGMAYIGQRPTINGLTRNIEVNIFDFDREIYNQTIRVHFHHYIRADKKLNGLAALKEQLAQDKLDVLAVLK